jgi:hypothetical protein
MSIFMTGLSKAGVRRGRHLAAESTDGGDRRPRPSMRRSLGEAETLGAFIFRDVRIGIGRQRREHAAAGEAGPAFAAA